MIKPFDKIPLKNKEKLIKYLRGYSVKLMKNEHIIDHFKDDDDFGIIVSGVLKVVRTNYNGTTTIIEKYEVDDMINISYISMDGSEYEIIADENTEILLFSYNTLISLDIQDKIYNQFIKNLFIMLNEIITLKNERIVILTKKTIRDKLLEYFNINSKKNGSKYIYLPFNFSDLANYLGIDRSAMSRELGFLKEEGFITIKGKRITLMYR